MSLIIRPQKGFQEHALATPADIAILGGSAGCGKTFTLLLENIRHITNPKFGSVIFRRTSPQITSEGGLWDTSETIFPLLAGMPIASNHRWVFPSKASVKFSHLEYDKNVLDWQGAQIPLICFDELTHFSFRQFIYMLSRNRTDCGVKPYIRATCNPDPDSWVATFIEWWIDQITGFPIPERAGVLRYMVNDQDTVIWGDTPQEVIAKAPHLFEPLRGKVTNAQIIELVKSVTFIPGSILEDNQIFIGKDPGYLGALLSLPEIEKAQLLDGNWKMRSDGLGLFNYDALNDLFTNYPEQGERPLKCITVDPARFGRDFCVLYVWKGWEVIHISVYKKSDVHDVVNHIEFLRRKFNVTKSDVIVDQDGVGGGTVKLGQYHGFSGNANPLKEPETRIKEYYKNLKTQCYYRLANRVNNGGLRINANSETVLIYDDSKLTANYSTKIKVGQAVKDIRDLIKDDLKAIKRAKMDMDLKMQINPKDEQKIILGRSPDFGDTLMMREYVDLRPRPQTITKRN